MPHLDIYLEVVHRGLVDFSLEDKDSSDIRIVGNIDELEGVCITWFYKNKEFKSLEDLINNNVLNMNYIDNLIKELKKYCYYNGLQLSDKL